MTHVVTEARAAVRAALQAAITDVTWATDWWQQVDVTQLPRGGVSTPVVRTRHFDVTFVERTVDLLVMVKLTGRREIEDALDLMTARIEEAVVPALAAITDEHSLAETQTGVEARGETSIGEVSMLFRAVLRTAESEPR